MSTGAIVAIVISVILIAAIVALIIVGKKAQKKQAEQQVQLDAMKQTLTMLIIDKKRMKLNESGLPQSVIEQTPKLLRRSKLPGTARSADGRNECPGHRLWTARRRR